MVKRYTKRDPHADREKQNYENPIASRELILDYMDTEGKAVTRNDIIAVFSIEGEEQLEALRRRLRAMERDGQIISNRRGRYALVKHLELIRGNVTARKDGYGFLIPDDGSDDLYLSSYQMRQLFPNDIALARVAEIDNRGRKEGAIVEILERNTEQLVGYFRQENGISFVEPEKREIQQVILISPEETLAAREGDIVIVSILTQPTLRRQPTGKITEILGQHMAPGLEIDVAIRSHGLPYLWQEDQQKALESVPSIVTEEEIKHRKDLRHLAFVTIDGEDAKDFDDAVFAQYEGNEWRLFVAIADVSHYVSADSALDIEARHRGNSVYFPNRVIPMLPEELSNGICSLKPKVDRLCVVAEMQINKNGELQHAQFYEAVIHSKARLTYTEVAQMLEGEKTPQSSFLPEIKTLCKLYQQLLSQRLLRGALDFETTETRIIFGREKKIAKIIPVVRNEAHRLIEECMLIANVATAQFLTQHHLPLLYRIHKVPDTEKLENLRQFLTNVGLRITFKTSPTPMDYAKLLSKISGRVDAHIIQMVLLRSLKQAVYSPVNEGHFGLAYDSYCHFTSPIRRFPDVLVHRAIKYAISKKSVNDFRYTTEELFSLGDHCSMTERRADEATRDVINWLKCEYMLDKVGEEFEGVISEVTGFGIFVELKDIYVEGLVHITALKNDYYHFDAVHRRLQGKRTNISYGLGDLLQVRVVRVDLDQKKIDFDLANSKEEKTKKPVKKASSRKRKKRASDK